MSITFVNSIIKYFFLQVNLKQVLNQVTQQLGRQMMMILRMKWLMKVQIKCLWVRDDSNYLYCLLKIAPNLTLLF